MNSEDLGPLKQEAGAFEAAQSRGRFLRKLGLLAAAGTAAVFFPATTRGTTQSNTICCKDATCSPCGPGLLKYRCTDSCNNKRCCVCNTDVGQCFVEPCDYCL